MSDLVGNPEDRFSCVAAHIIHEHVPLDSTSKITVLKSLIRFSDDMTNIISTTILYKYVNEHCIFMNVVDDDIK